MSKVSEQKLAEIDDIVRIDDLGVRHRQEEASPTSTRASRRCCAEQVASGRDKVLEALVEADRFDVPDA